ncbi:MAG: aminotransferase class III-fold pyridoxal phosphate-dependent enzyme [Chloroflexi bacterium]|nr:aminotransferase class III-fold pyridoxal phosphate-dependent enzyme [Chloroflexota bacterium]
MSTANQTVNIRPCLTTQAVIHLAQTLYGVTATAQELPSERDQNFHLKDATGQAFVLKVSGTAEQRAVLDFQNQAITHLADHAPDLPCPRICKTVDGEEITRVDGDSGTTHFVRLLTYLPGKPLALVKPQATELLQSLGSYLGQMDKALATFDHPATHRDLHWDVKQASQTIRQHKDKIADPARRALVEQLLAYFEQTVAPLLPGLRSSVIHGDANDYNVLVGDDPARGLFGRSKQVVGVIDFGDMVHTYTVCEVAIAAAYVMLDKADPLAAATQVVSGYHAVYPLTALELSVLYPLICMRLCMSVSLSAHQQALEPDNRYLSISEQPAWTALEKLVTLKPALAHYAFRQACGLPACPQTPPIEQWLRAHADQLHAVINLDLKTAPALVFDWSFGSLEMDEVAAVNDTATFTETLFRRMQRANVLVGIGRYNEARLVYTGDQFALPSDELPERRTVHLGIDLFQPAGSPIFAPLDGIVHSFANNAAYHDYGPVIILEHTVPDGGQAGNGLTFYTLYGHLSEDSLAGLTLGKAVKKGEPIATIGNYPTNGDWPPHLHFQIICDLLGEGVNFNGVAAPSQRELWLSLSPDPNLILQIPPAMFPPAKRPKTELLAARRETLGKSLSISYKKPLKIVRGVQQFLYDEEGYAYLDVVNNVCHVGHCHPHVVKAAQAQMAVLNTNTRYLHDNIVDYAERLCATLPAPLRVCFFVNSGSEANDLALRLARAYTNQQDVICVDVAYHGNLTSLIDVSPYKFDGAGGKGAPARTHVALMPDPYRGKFKGMDAQSGAQYADHVRALVAQVQQQGRGIAAFIAESVLGCGGQIVLPEHYLAAAYQHVRAVGGVCIADEVQVGFGRVGTHFWGFETQGVVPDIVTMGKPIGNGHPLGAVVTTPAIADAFANGMEYFNTFGGNPVSCAVGLAVLDVIETEGLQSHAYQVGQRLMAGLHQLMNVYPLIGDVRGLGLFVGVELVLDRHTLEPAGAQASYVAERMRDHGILISTDGPFHNVLKLKPPLVFNQADADRLVATLGKILAEDAVVGPR